MGSIAGITTFAAVVLKRLVRHNKCIWVNEPVCVDACSVEESAGHLAQGGGGGGGTDAGRIGGGGAEAEWPPAAAGDALKKRGMGPALERFVGPV